MNFARSTIRAFTLIEAVLAIAILCLIVGGVMAILQACLQSTEIVREERTAHVRRDVLQGLLQRSFLTLPMDTTLRCLPGVGTGAAPAPLQLRARQPAIVFTSSPWKPGRQCISAVLWRRQADGSFTLGGGVVANETTDYLRPEAIVSPEFPWIPLLPGIRAAQWRFFDATQSIWLEKWDRDDTRPSLVELSMEFTDSSTPFRGVFWIPNPKVGEAATGRTNPEGAPRAEPSPTPAQS